MHKKSVFEKKKHIPWYLVPKVRKRHARPIFNNQIAWRLFAEGALRNWVFHEGVMHRGTKCMACNHHFNNGKTTHHSHIEKHHHCYLRLCIGDILPEDSEDIYRPTKNGEFEHVPDCRKCKMDNPEYYQGCVKKIFPVHGECHEDIHELEKWFFKKLSKNIRLSWKLPETQKELWTKSPSN